MANGKSLDQVFPGIGSVQFQAEGTGPRLNLRTTKGEGLPVTIVPEGTPGAGVVALKRVDELGYYNLSHRQLEEKLSVGAYSITAAIAVLDLKSDAESSKLFKLGAVKVQRYSQKALASIGNLLEERGQAAVRAEYQTLLAARRQGSS